MSDYADANGVPIEVGRVYWSNNLDLVCVIKIADWPADRQGDVNTEPYCSPWHKTVRLPDGAQNHFDSGRHGRLASFHPSTRLEAGRAVALDERLTKAWQAITGTL